MQERARGDPAYVEAQESWEALQLEFEHDLRGGV